MFSTSVVAVAGSISWRLLPEQLPSSPPLWECWYWCHRDLPPRSCPRRPRPLQRSLRSPQPRPLARRPAPIPATEGVLLATPEDGIAIVGFDGTTGRLSSDRNYESIAWVISDGAGGIIFQHEVTPLPWAQGTILHLPAAATNPVEVVVPDPGTYLRPLDVDAGLLIYRVDSGGSSEVRAIDLGTRAIRPLIPATEFLIGAAADEGVVVSAVGGDCPSLESRASTEALQATPSGMGRLPDRVHQ